LNIKLQGTSKFAKVVIIRDGKYVYSSAPDTQNVQFTWRDNQPNKGKNSYYYVRGEQTTERSSGSSILDHLYRKLICRQSSVSFVAGALAGGSCQCNWQSSSASLPVPIVKLKTNGRTPLKGNPQENEDDGRQRILYYSYAAGVGILLLLNWLNIFRTVNWPVNTRSSSRCSLDTRLFYGSIQARWKSASPPIFPLCAVVAALLVGEYLAAAEAMFIVLVAKAWNPMRPSAPRRDRAFCRADAALATVLRDGNERTVSTEELHPATPSSFAAESAFQPMESLRAASRPSMKVRSMVSRCRRKRSRDEVFSGTLNHNVLLRIRVTRSGSETTLRSSGRIGQAGKRTAIPGGAHCRSLRQVFSSALLLSPL